MLLISVFCTKTKLHLEACLPLQISLGNKVEWFQSSERVHDYKELGRFSLLQAFHSLKRRESLPEETKAHLLLPGQGDRPRVVSMNV